MGIINQVKHGKAKGTTADPVLTRIVEEDAVSWIRKPNLRNLYFLLVPAAIGIEITSGFDSQLINALQIVPSWITCKKAFRKSTGGLQELTLYLQISITQRVRLKELSPRRIPSEPFSHCLSSLWLITGLGDAALS